MKSRSKRDAALWGRAVETLRGHADTPAWQSNVQLYVEPLVPLGRSFDGTLWLRAPRGLASTAERFRPLIGQALADAGDATAGRVVIVDG